MTPDKRCEILEKEVAELKKELQRYQKNEKRALSVLQLMGQLFPSPLRRGSAARQVLARGLDEIRARKIVLLDKHNEPCATLGLPSEQSFSGKGTDHGFGTGETVDLGKLDAGDIWAEEDENDPDFTVSTDEVMPRLVLRGRHDVPAVIFNVSEQGGECLLLDKEGNGRIKLEASDSFTTAKIRYADSDSSKSLSLKVDEAGLALRDDSENVIWENE